MKVELIIHPRRFGKTLNMTMLRGFFDIMEESSSVD
ncbi:AAA family ATPase [Enterocloster hominis (ex Hitch et al. 2024)]